MSQREIFSLCGQAVLLNETGKKKKKAERYIGAPRGHSGRDHHSVNLIGKKITSMFFHIYRNIIVI